MNIRVEDKMMSDEIFPNPCNYNLDKYGQPICPHCNETLGRRYQEVENLTCHYCNKNIAEIKLT